jgi:hypothetical protein
MRLNIEFSFVYGDYARVDKAERGGAQTRHVRSALVVANDISFGCLKYFQKIH